MAKAWIFQDPKQVQKHGAEKAAWRVGWYDPEGKRKSKGCGAGALGKSTARKLREKIVAELLEGTYRRSNDKRTWQEFRGEFEQRIADHMEPRTRRVTLEAIRHFERLIKPKFMRAVKTQTIDDFIAIRRTEAGQYKGDTLSPASVNKELRHLKAALRISKEWGYLVDVPKFRMLKEPGKLPTFVTGEHFAAIYKACESARLPADQPYSAAEWWHGLLVMAYMTGWRIGELLSLRRVDLDLATGTAVTRAEDNKGKRDELIHLHPVVVEHLRRLPGFDQYAFPWNHNERTLYAEFARIQEAANSKLVCSDKSEKHEHGKGFPCHVCGFLTCTKKHKHTRFCYVYGFHDLRRAFATLNAKKLSPDDLQSLMRHKSYLTTKRYINMVSRLEEAVAVLHVPDVLKEKIG